MSNLNFASIQHLWLDFWSLTESKLDQAEEAKLPMSKAKLKLLLTIPEVQSFIQVRTRLARCFFLGKLHLDIHFRRFLSFF